ncbi:hypothetical protein LC040_12075 [Bacillus tianshenii]|nr:hypothetical protein LC040_12075 [Bacillus tianshenii]
MPSKMQLAKYGLGENKYFATVRANGVDVAATTVNDVVELLQGENIDLTVDPIGKTITISSQGGAKEWQQGEEYKVNNLIVKNGAIYIASIDFTSSEVFENDVNSGKIQPIVSSSGGNGYSQFVKLSAGPGDVKSINLSTSNFTFDRHAFALILEGESDVSIDYSSFTNGEASDFKFDSQYVVFDGEMKLKTEYTSEMNEVGVQGSVKVFEGQIDVRQFKNVERISF